MRPADRARRCEIIGAVPVELVFVGLMGVVAAMIGGTMYFAPEARTRREVGRARRHTIADAPEGAFVRVAGTIVAGPSFPSPLTGRACVYCEVEVQGETRKRPLGRTRVTVTNLANSVAFAIDDGTGLALIDPRGAKVALHASLREGGGGDNAERQRAVLASHGRANGSLFREGIIAVGDKVEVCGLAVREPDPDGAARATGYRGDSPTRLRVAGSAKQPLLMSDAPGAVD